MGRQVFTVDDTTKLPPQGVLDALDKVIGGTALAGIRHSKVTTDGTDQTSVLLAELTALLADGGGSLLLPEGTVRLDGQIDLPFTLDSTGAPVQAPLTIIGTGAWASGRGSSIAQTPVGGTQLDLRYAGTGAAKVLTRGFGRLTIRGVTFTDLGVSSVPFFKTTNTTVDIQGNAFIGNPSKRNQQCDQDAIILGGSTTPTGGDFDTTDNGPFQGYGSIVAGNWFNRVRRVVFGQTYCNGVTVRDNTVWQACGSNLTDGACIEFNSGTTANSVFGNVITGNLIEVGAYPYGIKLDQAQDNTVAANNFYDQSGTTIAYIYAASGAAKYNHFSLGYGYIGGTWPGGVHVKEAVAGTNTIVNAAAGVSQHVGSHTFLTGMRTAAAVNRGAGAPEVIFGTATTAAGIYTGAGAPEGNITAPTGSLYLRTSGDYGTTVYVKEAGDAATTGWVPLGPYAATALTRRTSAYTMTTLDRTIVFDSAAGATVTLLDPATAPVGRPVTVKNVNATSMTVATAGTSKTIDGAATVALAQWQTCTVVSDGTNWLRV
ncbi:hypothetical protein [Frigoribacterium sp. MCBA15_019]|uniref:hypothetical protein n=1 Tax=Frigoribacterium sp. MCBA15_019 TaxID=1898745 RepID=UPI0008DD1A83|nr:hypothetical protein [Frigoribacterium sp. MCBA15_019]OII27565.1 hypothetical protein BIV04_03250 [Frigoribacterium sp. MCBA15_019]